MTRQAHKLQHRLKHRPSDFVVSEVLVPRNCSADDASHEYFSLAKSGYTTMEATRVIASAVGVPSTAVTYAGLKDEDGVTEQLVALPAHAMSEPWWEQNDGQGRYLRLMRQGYGPEPLTVGALEGNAFRVLVRDLDPPVAERLSAIGSVNHSFLNYYDIQRFGVPNGPRRTHFIGESILNSRWDAAIAELVALRAPESESAADWTGSAEDFFRGIDPRTTAFYLSAHGSAQWNARLRQLTRSTANGGTRDIEIDGIEFTYLQTGRAAREIFLSTPDLDYLRYYFIDNEIVTRESHRATVVHTRMAFGCLSADDVYPGRSCIEARFFLPSGCYATAAIRQLFSRTDILPDD